MKNGVATLADIKAIERKSLAKRNLPRNTYQALQRGASINPNKIGLRFFLQGEAYADQMFYTYQDLVDLVNQAANMFNDLGVSQNDVVSMILPNIPQSLFTIWGAEVAGIVNPIDPRLEAAEMAAIMNAAGTKVLVTMAPFPGNDLWEKVALVSADVPSLQTILRVDMAHYLSTLQRWTARYIRFRGQKAPDAQAEVLDFGEVAVRFPAERLVSDRDIKPQDIASLHYVADLPGSSGLVRHTHRNKVFTAWALSELIGMSPDKVVFCGRQLYDLREAVAAGLMPFMHGACLVLGTPQGYSGSIVPNFWPIVELYKINMFTAEADVLRSFLDEPETDADISSLAFAISSVGLLPEDEVRRIEEQTPLRILEGYGVTGGTCFSSLNPPSGVRRNGSAGLRLPFQEMKVVHLDDDGFYQRDCAANETGTIIIRGPNVFSGYVEETVNRQFWLDTRDGNGPWLNTCDQGRRDADGYFWISA